MDVVKPRWTSSSFLLYLGAFTVLASMTGAYAYLSANYGAFAFVAWTLLMLAILLAIAVGFRRRHWIAAGLFAYLSVTAFGTFVGALFTWWGWGGDSTQTPFGGWHWVLWLLILIVLVALAAALRAYRFPLLVLPLAVLIWFLVTDIVSGGGGRSAVVTLFVGIVYFGVGMGANRVYGFWWHVVSGGLVGGALLYWWHSSTADWWLLAITGLIFIALGTTVRRSSWTVYGALALLGAATHFSFEWARSDSFFGLPTKAWVPIVVSAVLGFLFVVLGLWAARRVVPE